MYARYGFISEAKALFHNMPERSTVSWNSLIFRLANHSYCDEAVDTFLQMEKKEAERIDHVTFTAAPTACSHSSMTELGENLFSKMQEVYGITLRLEHYACVVDLLEKAGKLVEVYDLIKTLPMEPNLFVWVALLGACRTREDVELARLASQQLAKLEHESPSSSWSLSGLYADAGSWSSVTRLKMALKEAKRQNSLAAAG